MHATDADLQDHVAAASTVRRFGLRNDRRKLHIARHAQGTDAIGWVLLGFVAGAATAIFALTHADFPGRKLLMAPTASARPTAEPQKVAALEPAKPIAKPAPASTTTAAPVDPNARPWTAPSNDAQVAEDAAAAGMTARTAPPSSAPATSPAKVQDLY